MTGETGRDFLDDYRGDGPLRDITVLDFSQLIMGPIATQMMGDLGALVIKIEPPETGEFERTCLTRGRRFRGESPHFLALNRNKLSVLANLKDEADREMVLDIARRSDIVVNNFRPGVMERLGVGYDQLREANPQIVFGQGTGYGSRGPMAALPGQDLLVQAMSGLAANSGSAGEAPVASGSAVSDAAAGFLFGFSLMAAVHGARATGAAQFVDVSLLGASLSVQCLEAFMYMNMPEMELVRSETGIAAPWFGPPYGFYETSDGWICVSMTPRPRAVELFNLDPDLEHLDDDQWYERRDEINKAIAAVLVNRSTDEWLSEFAERDVWASPLLELNEAVDHPQVEANDFIETISLGPGRGEARAVGLVAQVGEATTADRLPPPLLGEHNEIVAQALGGNDD